MQLKSNQFVYTNSIRVPISLYLYVLLHYKMNTATVVGVTRMKNPRVCLGAINNKGVLFRPILATEIWKETDSIAKLGQQFEYTIGSETKKIFPHSTEDVLVTGYKMLPNKSTYAEIKQLVDAAHNNIVTTKDSFLSQFF